MTVFSNLYECSRCGTEAEFPEAAGREFWAEYCDRCGSYCFERKAEGGSRARLAETSHTLFLPKSKAMVTVTDNVEKTPLWVIALHRLARLGKANNASSAGSSTLVRFDLHKQPGEAFAEKWAYLFDADAVTLVYREKGK